MEAEATEENRPKITRPLLVLLLIFSALFLIDSALSWTNWKMGLGNGAFHLIVLMLPFAILFYQLPWTLLVRFICRKSGQWKFYRPATLLPVIFFCLLQAPYTFRDRSTESLFKTWTKTDLPEGAVVKAEFHFGGGLADHIHSFYFETTKEETEKLIAKLKLTKSFNPLEMKETLLGFERTVSGYDSVKDWNKPIHYRNPDHPDPMSFWIDLYTDETHTKVIVRRTCF